MLAPPNPECSACPLFGKDAPCTRIFFAWNTGRIRRPEVVRLLATLNEKYPDCLCRSMVPDLAQIEARPASQERGRIGSRAADRKDDRPSEHGTEQDANTAARPKIAPFMVGRLPRRDRFSLRDQK